MRTSINFSSFTSTTYYAVGKDTTAETDPIYDSFIDAIGKYPEVESYIESKTDDSIMFRIPNEASNIQLIINKIAMLAYQGCVYKDGDKPCKRCSYKGYCEAVNGKEAK